MLGQFPIVSILLSSFFYELLSFWTVCCPMAIQKSNNLDINRSTFSSILILIGETRKCYLHSFVVVEIFAIAMDAAHRQAAAMVHLALESLVERAVSVLMPIFSSKLLVSRTLTIHHRSVAIPKIMRERVYGIKICHQKFINII